MDRKWFAKCEMCKRKRIFIKKREVKIPTGHTAKSQKLMCGSCFRAVNVMLSLNDKPQNHGG